MSDLTNHIQSLLMRTCNDPKCRSDHRKDAVAAIALVRAEVLEEAARVADDRAVSWDADDPMAKCAAAIRALGEKA